MMGTETNKMDPMCKRDGCYMFAPGTSERAECEGACRLNAQHLAAANDPRETRSSPEVVMYDINNDLHATVSGRLSSTRRWEPQFAPSTSYDGAVAAGQRGVTARGGLCMRAGSPDYAALEMRVMAALMNKKEGG
jgi:hypothetical protein